MKQGVTLELDRPRTLRYGMDLNDAFNSIRVKEKGCSTTASFPAGGGKALQGTGWGVPQPGQR